MGKKPDMARRSEEIMIARRPQILVLTKKLRLLIKGKDTDGIKWLRWKIQELKKPPF